MSGLVLPRHVAQAVRAQNQQKVEVAIAESIRASGTNRMNSDDFLSPRQVQEQLNELAAHVAAERETNPDYRLPKPSGWRIMVLMLTIPETSDGGVIMPGENREARAMGSPQGVILSLGRNAYSDRSRFLVGNELVPWHVAGDRIIWVKYDATTFQLPNGQRIGFMNDTQPAGMIDDSWNVDFAAAW